MKRKEYQINIEASKEQVWDVLWNDESYPKWTAAFAEGSHAETDWKEGSKVLFLGPDSCGMVSKIIKVIKHEYMSIEHQGVVRNGNEEYTSSESKDWKGAQENYTLTSKNGKTELFVETDVTEEYLESFDKAWPKALQLVKELSEK